MRLVNFIGASLLALAGPALAGEADKSVQEGVQASGHASGSAAHAIAASGQVTSAASVVPLAISGGMAVSAGTASTRAAGDSLRAAAEGPLPVGDESATVMPPPDEALKKAGNKSGL